MGNPTTTTDDKKKKTGLSALGANVRSTATAVGAAAHNAATIAGAAVAASAGVAGATVKAPGKIAKRLGFDTGSKSPQAENTAASSAATPATPREELLAVYQLTLNAGDGLYLDPERKTALFEDFHTLERKSNLTSQDVATFKTQCEQQIKASINDTNRKDAISKLSSTYQDDKTYYMNALRAARSSGIDPLELADKITGFNQLYRIAIVNFVAVKEPASTATQTDWDDYKKTLEKIADDYVTEAQTARTKLTNDALREHVQAVEQSKELNKAREDANAKLDVLQKKLQAARAAMALAEPLPDQKPAQQSPGPSTTPTPGSTPPSKPNAESELADLSEEFAKLQSEVNTKTAADLESGIEALKEKIDDFIDEQKEKSKNLVAGSADSISAQYEQLLKDIKDQRHNYVASDDGATQAKNHTVFAGTWERIDTLLRAVEYCAGPGLDPKTMDARNAEGGVSGALAALRKRMPGGKPDAEPASPDAVALEIVSEPSAELAKQLLEEATLLLKLVKQDGSTASLQFEAQKKRLLDNSLETKLSSDARQKTAPRDGAATDRILSNFRLDETVKTCLPVKRRALITRMEALEKSSAQTVHPDLLFALNGLIREAEALQKEAKEVAAKIDEAKAKIKAGEDKVLGWNKTFQENRDSIKDTAITDADLTAAGLTKEQADKYAAEISKPEGAAPRKFQPAAYFIGDARTALDALKKEAVDFKEAIGPNKTAVEAAMKAFDDAVAALPDPSVDLKKYNNTFMLQQKLADIKRFVAFQEKEKLDKTKFDLGGDIQKATDKVSSESGDKAELRSIVADTKMVERAEDLSVAEQIEMYEDLRVRAQRLIKNPQGERATKRGQLGKNVEACQKACTDARENVSSLEKAAAEYDAACGKITKLPDLLKKSIEALDNVNTTLEVAKTTVRPIVPGSGDDVPKRKAAEKALGQVRAIRTVVDKDPVIGAMLTNNAFKADGVASLVTALSNLERNLQTSI